MPGRAEPTANPTRIASVDLLRGIVMIIMALDHVRDYFGIASFVPEDLSQSGTAYFFTRWITHFSPVQVPGFIKAITVLAMQDSRAF